MAVVALAEVVLFAVVLEADEGLVLAEEVVKFVLQVSILKQLTK